MKNWFTTFGLMVFLAISSARAEEKTPTEEKNPQAVRVQRVENANSESETSGTNLMMKIPSNEEENDVRRKTFIEELRKLYKANFL